MNKSRLVSIVIPCYNHENFVQDTIQSVIDQTYQNIELIIIDDGSKDKSTCKIQEMIYLCEQRFVRFEFRTRPNKGLSATLNEAVEWCEGEYFSAIASDDIMLDKKTAIQVNILNENQHITAVFGGVILIDDNNNEMGQWLIETRKYDFKSIILHQHNLPAPTQMIRLESIRKVKGYDEKLFIEDWYMWIKLSLHGDIYYKKEIFTLYRQHNSNISKNLVKMQQGRLDVLSRFKDSIHYKKALANIKWINACESHTLGADKKERNTGFLGMFLLKPFKVSNMLFKQFIRILKGKNGSRTIEF